MNILKYTNRFIKSGFVGITCLACFSSCNYLDVIPPAQPDMEDTMTDKSATLGFYFPAMLQYWSFIHIISIILKMVRTRHFIH